MSDNAEMIKIETSGVIQMQIAANSPLLKSNASEELLKEVLQELKSIKMEVVEIKEKQMEQEARIQEIHDKIVENELAEPPKEPKNWNDLPPELKIKIINDCDIKMRSRVARTSRLELALVKKSAPIVWNIVKFVVSNYDGFGDLFVKAISDQGQIVKEFDYYYSYPDLDELNKQLANLLVGLFQKGNVLHVQIDETDTDNRLPQILLDYAARFGPYRFKTISDRLGGSRELFPFFMQNCGETAPEKIELEGFINNSAHVTWRGFEEKNFFTAALIQLDFMTFRDAASHACVACVVQSWIQTDVPVGLRMLFRRYHLENCFHFVSKAVETAGTRFAFRNGDVPMVKNRNEPRRPKTILIREEMVDSEGYISCVVIPTKLRPSEYENAQDWFWKVPKI